MKRISRVFRIWMLVAILAGAFSPLTQLELAAEDPATPEPTIEVDAIPSEDPTGEQQSPEIVADDDQAPGQTESPDTIVPLSVTPQSPVVAECGDAAAIQLPTSPEGIQYELVETGEGSYIVEARIIDPLAFEWAELTDPWNVVDGVAAYPVILEPCVEEETLESKVNIPKGSDEPIDSEAGTPEADSMHQQSSNGPANDSLNIELSVETELDHEGPIEPVDFITYRVHVTLNDESVNYQFTMSWSEGQEYNFIFYPWGVLGTGCNVDEPSRMMTCGIDAGTWVGGINNTQTWLITLRGTQDVQTYCTLNANFEGSAIQAGSGATWDTNNTAHGSVPTGQPCAPELSVDLSPETQTIEQGDDFDLQMTISNNGPAVSGIQASVTLPDSVHIADLFLLIPDSNNCSLGGEVLCTNLTIPENGSLTIPIEVSPYGRSATCGTYLITASVIDEQDAVATAELNIECNVNYGWTTSVSEPTVSAGDELTFTSTFQNTGNTAFSLNLQDTLPLLPADAPWDVTVFSTLHSSTTCQEVVPTDFTTTSAIDCEIYNAVPGASVTITATAIIPPDFELCGLHESNAIAAAINPLRVDSDGSLVVILGSGQTNIVPTGDADVNIECAGITVELFSDIAAGDNVKPGDVVTYTVEVENTGNVNIENYSLFNNLDWALTLDQLTTFPAEADCDPLDGVYLDCAVEIFAPETTHTYVFTAIVNDALTAEQCETGMTTEALLYASQIPDVDQPLIATDVTAIECTAIAHFQMSAVNPTVIPGESIAYTIDLENTGTLVLNDIDLVVNLPTLPEGGIWNVTIDGESVSLPLGIESLVHGESVSILIESSPIRDDLMLPDSEWCDDWSGSATVAGTFSNDEALNDFDNATVRVNCTGLGIEIEVSTEVVEVGEQVTFTITLSNHGNTVVNDVVVEYDISSKRAVFGNWSAEPEECEVDSVITCKFSHLMPNEPLVFDITADAPALPTLEQCDPVELFGSLTYQSAEQPLVAPTSVGLTPPNTPIESNTVTTQIDCQPEMELTGDAELLPGENDRMDAYDSIAYTSTVKNTGNMTIYGVTVTSGNTNGLTWDQTDSSIDELAPGESADLAAIYTITQADLDAGELSHTMSATGRLEPARITGKTEIHGFGVVMMEAPPLDTVHAEVSVVTALQQVPEMEMNASVAPEEPLGVGDEATFTFMVTNTGNVTLTDLSIASSDVELIWDTDQVVPVLAPGESASFIASYTVVAEDQDEIVVGAEVSAADPTGVEFTSSQSVTLQIAEVEIPEPTLEPTQEPTPGTIPPTEIPEETPDPTPHVTPDATPGQTSEATPDQSTEVTPAPGSAEPVDPSGKQIIELPKTGTGGALGPGQIIWIATVLIAMVFAVTIGSYRRRS